MLKERKGKMCKRKVKGKKIPGKYTTRNIHQRHFNSGLQHGEFSQVLINQVKFLMARNSSIQGRNYSSARTLLCLLREFIIDNPMFT